MRRDAFLLAVLIVYFWPLLLIARRRGMIPPFKELWAAWRGVEPK